MAAEIGKEVFPELPCGDVGPVAHAATTAEPSAALLKAIAAFRRAPPAFAMANKRGKFPMAALKPSADGASLDMEPLTHACTAASFEQIKGLIAALSNWQRAVAPADTTDRPTMPREADNG